MAKKWFGDGDFFCWHCGARIEKGKRKCPHCGAHYSGVGKEKYPPVPRLHPECRLRDRSFRAYNWRFLAAFLIWAGGISVIIPPLMKLWGTSDGSTLSWGYVFWVVRYVWQLLWAFWLLWAVVHAIGGRKKKRRIWEENRSSDGDVVCAVCGNVCDRDDNCCGRCGCLLLK